MSLRSIFGRKIKETITSDDLLGKEVIDAEGKVVGVIEKVLIDPKNLNLVGIEIDKGFIKKGVIVGKSYISKVATHAVFLKIRIVYEIKGMDVFDKIGKKIGKVKNIELIGNKNKLKNITVSRGLLSKNITIQENLIESIGESIILSVKSSQL